MKSSDAFPTVNKWAENLYFNIFLKIWKKVFSYLVNDTHLLVA
jgi:hypothetical protein